MYQLPHRLDRPGQLEALHKIIKSTTTYSFLDAETGLGKSALVAASSVLSQYIEEMRDLKTLVLTHTIALQKENYLRSYSFDTMMGKRNYPCGVHKGANSENCPEDRCSSMCSYKLAYNDAIASQRLTVNIAKYLIDPFLVEKHKPDILFIDEAHLLSGIIMEWSGGDFQWQTDFWDVKPQSFYGTNKGIQERSQIIINEFYQQLAMNMPDKFIDDPMTGSQVKSPEYISWQRMGMKLTRVTGAKVDFFYEADKESFKCKPLSARHRFKDLFGPDRSQAVKIVMMSATLPRSDLFAKELGIENDFTYIKINSYQKPEDRAVEVLQAPRLHYKATDKDYNDQADIIANKIKSLPQEWTGVCLLTSKKAASDLAYKLNRRGIKTFVPTPGRGTSANLLEWENNRGEYQVCCAWSFWEGISLQEDHFIFICKCPWPWLGDNYSKARKAYNPESYKADTAGHIQQGCGRIRRIDEDFGWGVKRVFIVDSAVNGVLSYFPPSFAESIIKEPRPVKKFTIRFTGVK